MLVTATTPMRFCSSYSPAELQKCSTATSPKDLCMPSAALLLSVARWQQPCLSLQLHLGDFAVHTALQNCRSDAQQPCPETCAYPLQPCLSLQLHLGDFAVHTALQNCSQWQQPTNYNYELLQFYNLQKCSTATMPTLCSPAAVSGKVALLQSVATALLIIATTIMSCCSSTTLQKCSTATMPRNLCMPSAALLLSVARWQQPCLSLQLHL